MADPTINNPPRFPTMLRKMWSGAEVQAWIDANWPVTDAPAATEAVITRAGQPWLRFDELRLQNRPGGIGVEFLLAGVKNCTHVVQDADVRFRTDEAVLTLSDLDALMKLTKV